MIHGLAEKLKIQTGRQLSPKQMSKLEESSHWPSREKFDEERIIKEILEGSERGIDMIFRLPSSYSGRNFYWSKKDEGFFRVQRKFNYPKSDNRWLSLTNGILMYYYPILKDTFSLYDKRGLLVEREKIIDDPEKGDRIHVHQYYSPPGRWIGKSNLWRENVRI